MTINLVLFDVEHWLRTHFEGNMCSVIFQKNMCCVISQNNAKQKSTFKKCQNDLEKNVPVRCCRSRYRVCRMHI